MNTIFKKKKGAMIVFVAPVVILFCLIIAAPLIESAMMSFTEWDGVNEAAFIGLDNYKKLFGSRDLAVSLRNSILFSVVLTVCQVGLGTFLAYVITNFEFRSKIFFRNVYFFPVLLSVSVVAQLWISIYNGVGYHMLIIYAAMRNVPSVYYEASYIDGANKKQQFFNITLPLSASTIKVCVVMCITYGFRAFEMIFLMTGGGPGNFSHTLPIMMYSALFKLQKYGYGSAIAIVIVVICVGLMMIINKATARLDEQY